MPVSMHPARIAIALALEALCLASCDLGIDVDSLSSGCGEGCDGGAASDAQTAVDVDAAALADVHTGADAATDAAPCSSSAGGAMVPVNVGSATVCVDRTEVTNAAYAAFLDAGAPRAATAGCDVDASYVPPAWPPPSGRDTYPVTSVTWCGARAFCTWAGKRLCGAIGGGSLDPSLLGRMEFDAWFAVCSKGGTVAYPYGAAYAPRACNGNDYGVGGPMPVGSLATCAADGGAPLDLSGNLWEWIDACDSQGNCFARGGAYNSPMGELTCARFVTSLRNLGTVTIGFRCCDP
jgi:formylglycine-generating enzyme required for sulfatase activity